MSKKLICLVSFVLALAVLSDASADLVGYWKLDEGSGTVATDTSGNGNDGTINGATWTAGKIGPALDFDGVDDDVDCGNDESLNITGEITIALWMKPSVIGEGGSNVGPVCKAESGSGWSWQLRYNAPGGGDYMGFQFNGDPEGSTWISVQQNLLPGEWYHIAGTFDGANIVCYLNGVETERNTISGIAGSAGRLFIGQDGWDNIFNGAVDDVRIYNTALMEVEIQPIMQGGGGFPYALGATPRDGAIDQDMGVSLSWRSGDFAVSHDVYFGDNFNDVNEASRTNPLDVLVSQNQEDTTYDPPGLLEFGQSYYWRVDEFNDLEPNSPWKGSTWSFTVIDHFVVDNFEDYNDYPPNEIFSTWLDGWEDDTNGATVGHDADFTKGENIVETAIVQGGKQSMPFYFDNSGTANYSEAIRTFSPAQDWTREGVGILSLWFRGHPAYVGGFTEEPAGTYTMTASGWDIWANADEFHFAFKQVTGASSIIAKVESLDNTHPFAKAGVMIRDSLDADSRYVGVFITPENGVRFQYRSTTGGITDRYFEEGLTAPHWVKLERTAGGLVRAYHSEDGATWSRFDLTQVSMDMPIYAGLALTSHVTDLTGEAKFSNVSFPDTMIDLQWTNQDVGMLSNEAEPMYITVGDGSSTAATVYHDNPDATLINTWTQWNVPLADLSNQGIVLTDISKMAIGFGSADNPQPGGSGLVFFDDIRLYQPAP